MGLCGTYFFPIVILFIWTWFSFSQSDTYDPNHLFHDGIFKIKILFIKIKIF